MIADQCIERIRPLLPIQNPLTSFVHNNVLMRFEHLYFHQGLREAAKWYGAKPYCEPEYYWKAYREGLITEEALNASIQSYLDGRLPGVIPNPAFKNEAFVKEVLFSLNKKNLKVNGHLRIIQTWKDHFGEPAERHLQDAFIPLVIRYLDQGMSLWKNPYQTASFLEFASEWVELTPELFLPWMKQLKKRFKNYKSIEDELLFRKLKEDDFFEYLAEVSLDLKGWAGIFQKFELEPETAPIVKIPAKLKDYLIVKILFENAQDEYLIQKHKTSFSSLYLKIVQKDPLTTELMAILQEAYDLTFQKEWVNRLENHFKKLDSKPASNEITAQFMFCIDDREEALRRHFEEKNPNAQTAGVVGFFGIDMAYLSLLSSKPTHQCPPVIKTSRVIREVEKEQSPQSLLDRAKKSIPESLFMTSYYGSRTLVKGFFASTFFGMLFFGALIAKIGFPHFYTRTMQRLRNRFLRSKITKIDVNAEGGYSIEEQAAIVEVILRACEISKNLKPFVFVVSHGSTNTNNPFRQAYGCGACSGNSGEPNSRAFTLMANDSRVRTLLKAKGLTIPDETLFVSLHHDTSIDEIRVPELNQLPADKKLEILLWVSRLDKAAKMNAFDRVQDFKTFTGKTEKEASQYVLGRAFDVAQPRPEYGHSRVSLAIFGRRELTRELDLERRPFLISYDENLDPDGSLLETVLVGALPVCANISLDYFFSKVDPQGFGAGSKLPINVAGLIGVITGSKSDLRIGLAEQMTEIHEPRRITMFIEASKERVLAVSKKNKRIRDIIQHEWAAFYLIDPKTRKIEKLSSHEAKL